MNDKNDEFLEKCISKNNYTFISYFLNKNKNVILELLEHNVSYKNIFLTLKEKFNLDVEYRHFCNQISKFKMRHIYQNNLSDNSHRKILAAKILENETPEKKEIAPIVETEKLPVNKINETIKNNENSGKKTTAERLAELRGNANLIQKKDAFVWKPSIRE